MIKVSIIVPVYNIKKKLLTNCLESLVNQTLNNIEIILIDDASTSQDTIKLLNLYNGKYDNIILITHRINKKQGGVRNTGLKISSGEFIGYVNTDDYIDLNMYQLLYNKAQKEKSDIVAVSYTRIKETGEIIFKQKSLASTTDSNVYLLHTPPFRMSLHRKSLIIDNKIFFLEDIFHDDDSISGISLMYAKNKISLVDEYLYYYVNHADFTVKNEANTIDDSSIAGKMYIINRGLFYKNKDVVLAKFYRVYFHSYYRSIMKYKFFLSILTNMINELQSYGFDINSKLVQNQLTNKQRFEIYLLMKLSIVFKIYTEIKFYQFRKYL